VLFRSFVLNKSISRLQWYALAVGYLGVIVVFIQDANSTGTMAILGMLLVFASACSYAIYMIGSGEMVKRVGSVRLVVYASSASTLMSVIQILIYDPKAIFIQTQQIYWLSLLNASLCTVIPMLLIMIAISRIGSPLVAQSGIVGPISTLFMGWLVLSEPVTWIQLGGMSLVIGAMWLLIRNDSPIKQEGLKNKKSLELEGSDPLN
jgi:drug/metabolite transporter (DMT)-like permease